MLRLTLKNLAANRLRFALTTFAVVLAVSFVVSSFVLTDGLRSSFNGLSAEIVDGTDFEVRPVDEFGQSDELQTSLLSEAATVDGVAAAAPIVGAENLLLPINGDGEQIPSAGPPQIVVGWIDDPTLSSFTLIEGAAPDGPGEFTMDRDAAANHGFTVGETYDVVVPTGLTGLTLTGLVTFGADNDTLGATLMQMDVAALQEIVGTDGYDAIVVALADNADRAAVEAELGALAPGLDVVDNATLESEQQADFNSGIDIIGNSLLGFAGVSLFVSIFIIYNTFSIVLGQRTRELALLRTVGADPVQLRRSVLAEAGVIGTLASAVGIGTGVGVALGLRSLFNAFGAQLPDSPIVVSTRTVLVAAFVGIGVTLISAVGPARKASRVSPMAALRDGEGAAALTHKSRLGAGAALLLLGAAAGAVGLFVASTTATVIALISIGAITMFVGLTLVSPVLAGPVAAIVGWPARMIFGVPGRLAQDNAVRNPQRTSTTAAALMIGLALVTMALVVGDSVKAQLRSTMASAVQADYLVTNDGGSSFPVTVSAELDALEQTDMVTSFRYDAGRVDGEIIDISATDLAAANELFNFDMVEGAAVDGAVADPVLVSDELATANGVGIGDTVLMAFPSGQERELTVIGVYRDDIIAEDDYLLDLSTWDAVGADPSDEWLALSLSDGVSAEDVAPAFAGVVERYPLVSVDSTNDFLDGLEGTVDQALAAVNVMVALAVIIALIGIANTLALSVFERTRELGLLRAVGMSRRQLRRMIRFEAALVALFGATLGVAIGVFFGWAAVVALPDGVTSTMAVPVGRIALLVAVAGAAGLIAAWGPARRASRLDVLDAISI